MGEERGEGEGGQRAQSHKHYIQPKCAKSTLSFQNLLATLNAATHDWVIYNSSLPSTHLAQSLKCIRRKGSAFHVSKETSPNVPTILRTFNCISMPQCSCCSNRNARSRYLGNLYISVLIFVSNLVLVPFSSFLNYCQS